MEKQQRRQQSKPDSEKQSVFKHFLREREKKKNMQENLTEEQKILVFRKNIQM